MKSFRQPGNAAADRRGAALVLSFMVMLVLILILAQIKYSTDTAERVARNEETLLSMDLAIESALLQVFEDLKADGESDSAAGAAGTAGQAGNPLAGAGDGGAGGSSGPTDSKEDEWAKAQRTEIGQLQLRIQIQDEDSKFNLLSVLTEDEEEADKALDRLSRVIELSRKGTEVEIDGSTARRMAEGMLEYMRRRSEQVVPRPVLLSDDEQDDDVGLPLSLREFVALDPELFSEDLFRDFLDEDEKVVHSLGSFLTVWSSVATLEESQAEPGTPSTGGGAGEDAGQEGQDGTGDGQGQDGGDDQGRDSGAGSQEDGGAQQGAGQGSAGVGDGQAGQESEPPPGWAINLNTAPPAVLRGLMEDRELPYRFWDDVILYRNEEDDTVEENEDPPLDEFGRPIVVKKFFQSIEDLAQIDGWENMEPIVQGELKALLKTQSQVFSIFITARKPTGEERIDPTARQADIEREEAEWQGLVRTVRAVVWRRVLGEGEVEIVPLVRWEALDYVPFEVLDFPESRESWGRR
jgi:hypothetical protein